MAGTSAVALFRRPPGGMRTPHYDMTLTNGMRITNVTKPVLDRGEGAFYYKNVAGTVRHISAGRVVEIKPHSGKNTTPGTLMEK